MSQVQARCVVLTNFVAQAQVPGPYLQIILEGNMNCVSFQYCSL